MGHNTDRCIIHDDFNMYQSRAVVSKFLVSQARPHQIEQKLKVTNFVCANRQIRLLSCMTCSLVPMQSSTYAAIVACSTECSTNNASHRYSYCTTERRQLRWKTGYEATLLHSCLWFPGNFPTELIKKKKKEPADRL